MPLFIYIYIYLFWTNKKIRISLFYVKFDRFKKYQVKKVDFCSICGITHICITIYMYNYFFINYLNRIDILKNCYHMYICF